MNGDLETWVTGLFGNLLIEEFGNLVIGHLGNEVNGEFVNWGLG